MAVNLVLMAFGAQLDNHNQASFALLSFLRDARLGRVMVVTDQPDFYRFFGERIEIIPVDEALLTQWQGDSGFFWRIKIKAIEAAAQRDPGQALLYVDSDTFLAAGLAAIDQALCQGTALMHCLENKLSDRSNPTLTRMQRSLVGKRFAGIDIRDDSPMWNAGVIGLPAGKALALVRRSLQVCDEICRTDCTRRLVEQFAFSLVLDDAGPMQGCDGAIGHYWGNKPEWNRFITRFWAGARLRDDDLAACIGQVAQVDWRALPLEMRRRSSAERIKQWLDRLLPPRRPRYFSGDGQAG